MRVEKEGDSPVAPVAAPRARAPALAPPRPAVVNGPVVELRSDDPRVELQEPSGRMASTTMGRYFSSIGYTTVCTVPCMKKLPAPGAYTVAMPPGSQADRSAPIFLPRDAENVVVDVKTGSGLGVVGGVLLSVFGGIGGGVGAVFAAVGSSVSDSGMVTGGTVTAIVGASMFGGGLYLLINSLTRVDVRADSTSDTALRLGGGGVSF